MAYSWKATLWYGDVDPVDHSGVGLENLLWQYQGKPRMQAVLVELLDLIDDLESCAFDVLAKRSVYTAEGVQLDALGRIVQQLRGELTDDEYRIFVLGRIFVNRMSGKIDEFYELLDMLGVTEAIYLDEGYPCFCRIDISGEEHGKLIGQLALDGAPAGVDLLWVYNEQTADDCFAFSSTAGADEVNQDGGFANLLGTTGGYMSGGLV